LEAQNAIYTTWQDTTTFNFCSFISRSWIQV
jgi:hypothetical protein